MKLQEQADRSLVKKSMSFLPPIAWTQRSMVLVERLIKKDEEPSPDQIEAYVSCRE